MNLITWNSQGIKLGGYIWRLGSKPDVMVVQEVGNLPAEFGVDVDDLYFGVPAKVGYIEIDRDNIYNCWWCGWSKQDEDGQRIAGHAGNLRCSMAMFYKDAGSPTAVWADNGKRPVLRKTISAVWVVCNIHAGGRDYIIDALTMARLWGKGKHWVVAGDFNQEPPTVRQWILPGEYVVAPKNPTRKASGKILDFAVSDRDGVAVTGPDYGGSDHLSVDITLY
jgi:hypothetical protein